MLPVVAILGRPNVGKSTLFNRLAGRRLAIVDDTPGVTRDRREVEVELGGRRVRLMDTAGLEEAPADTIPGRMRQSSEAALDQADLVLFVVDAKSGITPPDHAFADLIRRRGKPVLLIANKAEGRAGAAAALEAYALGLGDPIPISAAHGEGLGELHAAVARSLPDPPEPPPEPERPLRLALVGRPNAGKSTLLNALVGEERMITGPEPGLTRDAVPVQWRDAEGPVQLVDTPGLRRKSRITGRLEGLSVAATIAALREAEAVVLVVDATLGLHEQDLRIARLAEREGRAIVIALNKWDAVAERDATRRGLDRQLADQLAQLKGITVVPLSAATGEGVERLMPAVRRAVAVWSTRIPTAALNRWLEEALARHPPPLVQGRRLKLRYATMPATRPPTIALFGTRAERTPVEYQRYLVNALREAFALPGTPIRLHLRGTDNPYDDQQERG
ncbi:MAG: ribosome biogenesis GTPase Der [Rhodovarius sp.]|nr:ribosome biogenesis GTPase Der [Rhodovarius sp.]MCX7932556.1 ribosome biogenesis GTPase Der [Rhodovarius sp.]MDW8313347.1 ribosome biogenesis GTPase Der [Rhodovarius sp.]